MGRKQAAGRWVLGALVLGVAGTALAQAGSTLIMNGKVASTDVRVIGGKAYVPLADVAKALGQQVARSGQGYELTTAGGANQVEGLRGKIGDVLFDGQWRFTVTKVETVGSYKMTTDAEADFATYDKSAEFDNERLVYTPKEGYDLVVLRARLRNGTKEARSLWRTNSDTLTALTDDQGESYRPIAFDMDEEAPFLGKALLPGAGADLAVLFTVPRGRKLKDLVFTLRTIDEKGKEVRVSLTQ